MKQFIENIVMLAKVKYPKNRDGNESKNMTDVAYYVAIEIEKKYGGSWVVFITKEGSESGSCCVHVNGTHFIFTYEDEIYKIFQSRLWCLIVHSTEGHPVANGRRLLNARKNHCSMIVKVS